MGGPDPIPERQAARVKEEEGILSGGMPPPHQEQPMAAQPAHLLLPTQPAGTPGTTGSDNTDSASTGSATDGSTTGSTLGTRSESDGQSSPGSSSRGSPHGRPALANAASLRTGPPPSSVSRSPQQGGLQRTARGR